MATKIEKLECDIATKDARIAELERDLIESRAIIGWMDDDEGEPSPSFMWQFVNEEEKETYMAEARALLHAGEKPAGSVEVAAMEKLRRLAPKEGKDESQ